jgi:hypothetical protein
MLSVVMLSVSNKTHMLNVGMLSVILLSVVAPKEDFDCAIDDDLQIEKKESPLSDSKFHISLLFLSNFSKFTKKYSFFQKPVLQNFL